MLQYLVFRLFSVLAPLVPPRVAYRLCDLIGDLAYRLFPRQRYAVRRNLSLVLRDRSTELDRVARELFREGAKSYYDTFRVPALDAAALERLVSVEGWERLLRELDKGRGVVIFTAHLGSPALVASIVGVRGYRITTVVEAIRPRKLLDLMIRVRGSRGIRLIPVGYGCTRQLVEALRRNEIVGIVADRDVQGTGVRVVLFGTETTLPSGPVMLALRSGATLMPAFTYRCRDGRFAGRVGDPLKLDRTGDLREDIRLNTQKMAAELEKAIGRSPEQWTVFEPIWPERAGEAGLGAAG